MSQHEEPWRRRRVVLTLLCALAVRAQAGLVLGGGQASCSFVSGDTEDDEDDKHHQRHHGAPTPT